MDFSRPEYWVGSLSFHQVIFPTQGSNPALLDCRWDSLPAESPGKPKNTGVGSLSLFQQIFPTQELNQGLLHCRWILYQLNSQGSPFAVYTLHLAPRELPGEWYHTSVCPEGIGGESQWISPGLGPVYKGRRWERETPALLCLIRGDFEIDSTFEFSWDQRAVFMDIYQLSAFLWMKATATPPIFTGLQHTKRDTHGGRWEGGSRGRGTYVYLWLILVDIWQKPTQYYEAIILQLKK